MTDIAADQQIAGGPVTIDVAAMTMTTRVNDAKFNKSRILSNRPSHVQQTVTRLLPP